MRRGAIGVTLTADRHCVVKSATVSLAGGVARFSVTQTTYLDVAGSLLEGGYLGDLRAVLLVLEVAIRLGEARSHYSSRAVL